MNCLLLQVCLIVIVIEHVEVFKYVLEQSFGNLRRLGYWNFVRGSEVTFLGENIILGKHVTQPCVT